MGDLQDAIERQDHSCLKDLASIAGKKQRIMYEKEVQKLIKKGSAVWIRDGPDARRSRCWRWSKKVIVWSSPKVKELKFAEGGDGDCTVTLYVTDGWLWLSCPSDVWCYWVPQQTFLPCLMAPRSAYN